MRPVLTRTLPGVKGNHLTQTLVEVTYGPGGSSRAHTHGCPVTAYVIEGSVRMQMKGQPEAVYSAGQTFVEGANEVHLVSANASATQPARFLAIFSCDHKAELTQPVKASAEAR